MSIDRNRSRMFARTVQFSKVLHLKGRLSSDERENAVTVRNQTVSHIPLHARTESAFPLVQNCEEMDLSLGARPMMKVRVPLEREVNRKLDKKHDTINLFSKLIEKTGSYSLSLSFFLVVWFPVFVVLVYGLTSASHATASFFIVAVVPSRRCRPGADRC